jgi:hypothetical protein
MNVYLHFTNPVKRKWEESSINVQGREVSGGKDGLLRIKTSVIK